MILAGCFGLGILYRSQINGRIKALQRLMDVLELLEGEVRYGRSVLPECCLKVGKQIEGEFGAVLISVAQKAQKNEGTSFSEIFVGSVGKMLEEQPLTKEDKDLFFRFAVVQTGFADGQMQQRAMEQSRERLEKTKEKLERESAEKGRIAVSLGAMSGILLILILW